MSENRVVIEADTSPVDRAQDEAEKAFTSMKLGLEQIAQIGTSLAVAVGATVSQTAQLTIQTLRQTIQAVRTIAAARAASAITPAGYFLIGAQLATIITLSVTIAQIETGQVENIQRTQALVTLFSAIRY